MTKIGFGGGCFWCMEAVFQSVSGVCSVGQGWISPVSDKTNFSEAVLVEFDPDLVSVKTLIEIHLSTHSSASRHSLREKYRSAVYLFSESQEVVAAEALAAWRRKQGAIVTELLFFHTFRQNEEKYLNYYINHPEVPFCRTYIDPKIQLLNEQFPGAFVQGKNA